MDYSLYEAPACCVVLHAAVLLLLLLLLLLLFGAQAPLSATLAFRES